MPRGRLGPAVAWSRDGVGDHWTECCEAGSRRGRPGPGAAWLRLRNFAMRSEMAAYSVFIAARLTMRRAVERVISATSTRPLTRSVSPDCTRSTIRSARPTSGASSMEPSSRTISTWTRGAVGDVGGNIGGLEKEQPQTLALGVEDEPPRILVDTLDADLPQGVQCAVEQAALGQRQREPAVHGWRSIRAPRVPSLISSRS